MYRLITPELWCGSSGPSGCLSMVVRDVGIHSENGAFHTGLDIVSAVRLTTDQVTGTPNGGSTGG